MSEMTIAYYDRMAEAYWDGTRDHDVSQNYASLLDAIENDPPYSILDLGCGPGRDLRHFRSLGHNAVGLDGSKEFVAMARSYSGCEVLHQDFLAMVLPQSRFELPGSSRSDTTTARRDFRANSSCGSRPYGAKARRVRCEDLQVKIRRMSPPRMAESEELTGRATN